MRKNRAGIIPETLRAEEYAANLAWLSLHFFNPNTKINKKITICKGNLFKMKKRIFSCIVCFTIPLFN